MAWQEARVCRRYGAPLYSRKEDTPGVLRLRMRTIDMSTDATSAAHIAATNLPRYEKPEPARG